MRLLNTDTFNIEQFRDDDIPTYAIVSHTWGEEEVTFQDMEGIHAVTKKGFEKIKRCRSIAIAHGFAYLWIDTCCIDKTSSAELSEAINSMYRWYQEAEVCYAYLADVQSKGNISESRWFTRGWTLQELIAPSKIIFFDEKWKELGNKADLQQIMSDHTGIPVSILSGDDDLEVFSIAQRMSWAAERKTSRIEDRAYCLMGIFGVNMPLIYGERERAFTRLQEEIMRISDDHSLFAWKSPDNHGGLLATSPAAFIGSYSIVQFNPFHTLNSPSTVSSRGIHLELRFIGIGRQGLGLAILHCKERGGEDKLVAIYVRDLCLTMERFKRVQSKKFELLDLRKFRSSQYPMRRICIQAGMARMRKPKDFGKCDSTDPEESILDGTLNNFEESTTLLRAAERGLEDIVWLLLTRSDVEVNLKDGWDGRTPLLEAAEKGHQTIVKLLLVRGAQPDLGDKNGQTPLSRAIEGQNPAIVQLLLIQGAKMNYKYIFDDRAERTPLSRAAEKGNERILELLLENGAQPDFGDKDGQTPLSRAAEKGNERIVELLLENGAQPDLKNQHGQTPLSGAIEGQSPAVVHLLLTRGVKTNYNYIFDQAVAREFAAAREQAEREFRRREEERAREFFAAREFRRREEERAAAERAAVAREQAEEAEFAAREEQRFAEAEEARERRREFERAAAERAAQFRAAAERRFDQFRRTPLSRAAEKGNERIVELLLENGAQPDLGDVGGQTPLSRAAENGNERIVELLLKNGAQPDLEDKS